MFEHILGWVIEHIPAWVISLAVKCITTWDWLYGKINAALINIAVNKSRHRPHPWSTVHKYVSWTSLTDQRYSARHLPEPEVYLSDLPDHRKVTELFKRRSGKQRYCEKSTCLFPAFAQYLTDSFIRTKMPNTSKGEKDDVRRQNTSNHQIDLCPLYGRLPRQTHALRLNCEKSGKRGRLKSHFNENDEEYAPFLFQGDGKTRKSEFKDLDEPLGLDKLPDQERRADIFAFGGDRANAAPQVAMMNTLFLREHNRLAGEIEKCNPSWDDERVFQTARNVVIVVFIKIVVEEYINHITTIAPFRLRADPSVAWNAPWNKPNWITTEFSLLYRWHSLIPDTIKWNGHPYGVGATFMNNRILLNAGLTRAFVDLSSQDAGRLGAFNTADALLPIEEKAIEQGRICHVRPYCDYRAYVRLPKPKGFEDISKDKRVIDLLRTLYKSPSEVEFYVGLFAEDTVKNSPLPSLILRMVAVDAFSQALTNPLLSKHVYNKETFTEYGWEEIEKTSALHDVLDRNSPPGLLGGKRISMTQENWTRS